MSEPNFNDVTPVNPEQPADPPMGNEQPVTEQPVPALLFSNSTYEALRVLVQVILPGLATLYGALAAVWNWPATDKVAITITAIATFLGLILGVARKTYENSGAKYDGAIHVTEDADGVKHAALVLKNYENPADIVAQKEVTFKVNQQ